MMTRLDLWLQQVERDGFALLPEVFNTEQVEHMLRDLTTALHTSTAAESLIRGPAGNITAARNILILWPPVATVWHIQPLPEMLAALLGPAYGLVRVLYFDKPPVQTWALPWHKDLTIAVRDNRLPSPHFRKPTRKAGVPHVEAPQELLESMWTVRIHLDDVTEENGPLKIIPGSHYAGKSLTTGEALPRTLLARRGDVVLIRPLVEHSSGKSHPDTQRHRRVLHLEFSGWRDLPDGYTWHDFIPRTPVGLPGV
jgi:hypothetical protein